MNIWFNLKCSIGIMFQEGYVDEYSSYWLGVPTRLVTRGPAIQKWGNPDWTDVRLDTTLLRLQW